MKNWWRWFLLMALWWMGLFLTERILFLFFAHNKLHGIGWQAFVGCQIHGLPMDLSTTGYILLLSALLCVPLLFREVAWIRRTIFLSTAVVLVVTAIITSVDIGLFEAWGSRIDRKAISYLAFPKEAIASISVKWLLTLIAIALLQIALFGWLLMRIDHRRSFTSGPLAARIASAVLLPALCGIAARGGLQDLPIEKSWSYFSRHTVLNLAALNGLWNTLELAAQPADLERNLYVAMPTAEADRIFHVQHPPGAGSSRSILKIARPNILLIMLESWTADVIEPLGGDSGVTPQFTRLCKDGLLFDHFYSTGFRTEQGLCALISAFPSQPTTTIIRNYGKFDRLPSLVGVLGSAGYRSTYFYAGDVAFANTRAYLEAMGFDKVHDENSFPIRQRTRWGAFDEELFGFHLRESSTQQQPFFNIIMTATSHEPFDAPVHEGFDGRSDPQLYRNTVHYTDRCLGAFLDEAKKEEWYANTLILIVADHGHYLPHYRDQSSAARHRIPFLIAGGALRDELRGTTDSTFACHVDVPATLLSQLGLDHRAFDWSHDLFDPSVPHSAFWTFNDGFGIADSSQCVVFDEAGQRILEPGDSARMADQGRLLTIGKAHLQVLIDRYIGFNQ